MRAGTRPFQEPLTIINARLWKAANLPPRQTPWKASKKGHRERGGKVEAHELQRFFRVSAQYPPSGTPLPGLCRPRAHRRPVPARDLALAARPPRRRHLVLERLPRYGAAPEGARRHG